MQHEKFHYKTQQELLKKAEMLGVNIPLSDHTDILFSPVTKGNITLQNRLAIQPMEGCDAAEGGMPSDLTQRRYKRFAVSGAGLIWLEAVAITPEGRAKPNQLCINESNLDAYKRLVENIREDAMRACGFAPKVIMQAAHSGRYSNPNGYPEPIIAYNNPLFEKDNPIAESRIISDDALKQLEERFGWAAALAEQAGFDGVDVKCCHRYLLSEFLSAYTRDGLYGGSFENRTRLLRNSILSAKAATGSDFIITSRLNVYDGFPYPYGFGISPESGTTPDLTEALELVDILHNQLHVHMLNVTIGNPYVNPHVNRPYDRGNYIPQEHPLEGVARIMDCVGEVQKSQPDLMVIGSGFSYPRQFSVNMAAGMIEQGSCSVAGFGRMTYAYPDFIHDLRSNGSIDSKKCCVACGECAKLLRAGVCAGCVVRDNNVYHPHTDV